MNDPPPFHHEGGVTGGTTGGGTTTTGPAVTDAVQVLVHPEFETVRVYGVIPFDGGINIRAPDDPRRTLPGLRVQVRAHDIDHVSVATFPFITLTGFIARVQVGGVTGGGGTTTTGAAVTEAIQELVPAEFVTESVYGVTAFDGGVIWIEPDDPRITLPGFRVPVRLFTIDQVSVAPLPFITLAGLIAIVQEGGETMILAERSAKYEK